MFKEGKIKEIREKKAEWKGTTLKKYLDTCPEKKDVFETSSGFKVERVYTPEDISTFDYIRDLGFPGNYPFTRGIHATMYRARTWTMRQFAGYGTAEDTNKRFKYLLSHGETGLSVAFDFPTLCGYDSDHQMARGEIGLCGVAVDTLKDMEIIFNGIPLDKVTTSMTINGPAATIWAMYIVTGLKQGVPMEKLGGTIQNDILKEYMAQKSFIFPPEPSLKLVVDTIEFASENLPRWNPISISGYHIREAGANAIQELAFTLADGATYVEAAVERGLNVDDFAPRLSFFFACHNNFFEEIAKFRAARRIWAKLMKERFEAKKKRSMWLRFHTQTSGCTLTAQQPINNVVRVTIQALAAVLGGTQSLHTNSLDEALSLPSELAVRIALRTQQIIAHESGVTDTIDPLGGSYYVEWLTDKMEEECYRYFDQIEEIGGVVKGIEKGFFQREIARSAYKYEREVGEKKRVVVGVNKYLVDEPVEIPIFRVNPEVERRQLRRLRKVKQEREKGKVEESLEKLKNTADKGGNIMPYIIEAVKNYATLGEITNSLKEIYGEYKELLIY